MAYMKHWERELKAEHNAKRAAAAEKAAAADAALPNRFRRSVRFDAEKGSNSSAGGKDQVGWTEDASIQRRLSAVSDQASLDLLATKLEMFQRFSNH